MSINSRTGMSDAMEVALQAAADRREGYDVVRQEPPGGGQVTYQVIRQSDGAGLGAYVEGQVDVAIARDREWLAQQSDR